jgi:glycosyltransferase involved in cell wall biosynthesis
VRIALYHNLPSGGGKRALYEMARRLAARHTLDVYTLSCAEHEFCDVRPFAQQQFVTDFQPLPLARRPFGRVNQGVRALNLRRVQRCQQRVAQQIDAGGYDVVFAHNCQFVQSPGVLTYLRTPSVYYCGEPPRLIYEPRIPRPYNTLTTLQRTINVFDPFPGLYRATLRRLDRRNTLAATCVLANSAYSREIIYRIYGLSARIGYLGVDTDLFRPLTLPHENIVVSVGMVNPQKGFDFLIRGLARLNAGQRPTLVIVCNNADPRELAYLAALADEQQVTVEYRRLIPDEELVRLYNRARCTVYTPVMEPFGFVPLESMACGTPVIGIREAGVRESVIDGETGVLVERDPDQLAAALGALLDRETEADRLGQNGRQHALTHWTWDTAIATIERHLVETAGRKA